MKRILIAEDHPIMSAGASQMLRKCIPDAEITEVTSFWKACQAAENLVFDLVIMDIGIPGGDSVQMVQTFRSRWPAARLLMFSGYAENVYALPFVRAGAHGFLSKKSSENEFRQAIETVLVHGKIYLSQTIKDLSLDIYINGSEAAGALPHTSLSIREKGIAQLFFERKGVTDISSILNLSTSTVNTHRVRLFKKLGVNNMIDFVRKYELLYHAG